MFTWAGRKFFQDAVSELSSVTFRFFVGRGLSELFLLGAEAEAVGTETWHGHAPLHTKTTHFGGRAPDTTLREASGLVAFGPLGCI